MIVYLQLFICFLFVSHRIHKQKEEQMIKRRRKKKKCVMLLFSLHKALSNFLKINLFQSICTWRNGMIMMTNLKLFFYVSSIKIKKSKRKKTIDTKTKEKNSLATNERYTYTEKISTCRVEQRSMKHDRHEKKRF
jgi:hypothetical protein